MPGGERFVDEVKRIWDSGDAVLPVDSRLPAKAAAQLLETMGAAAIVDGNGERTQLPFARSTETGDALVMATSGSTGAPKGVVHTHASIQASARITSARLGVSAVDHWLACLPLSHIGGFSVISRALFTDAKLTVHPRFDADAVMQEAKNGVNCVSLVPTALKRVDAAAFKLVLLGGTAAPKDRPSNCVITYGSTETGSGIVYDRLPLDEVEISVDDNGQLLVKSPTLLRCYRDGTDPRTSDGWYATGDAGTIDTNGRVSVFGRIAEVINTGGEKVWPAVVENALKTHPEVVEALVFGEADEDWGQRVVAHVELANNRTVAGGELREHVKASLPAYAAPKIVRVVESLARTTNGKVDRRAIFKARQSS
jgi:o-succinylbenzoate---CoA ligase